MAEIAALASSTIRKLGASQTLTDPCSLVKELVENSLDARASAVFVEVSLNTLDRIRVRDNGCGISAVDRPLLCKRHCTSKIRSLDDLNGLGGQSMGFRGEALASAAELASALIVHSRVREEEVAAELKFDCKGTVVSQKCVSGPIGTTIEVQDFLSNHPVRKQSLETTSVKSLQKIKKLLYTYALARPRVKLSLKALKANSTQHDWTFAPSNPPESISMDRTLLFDAILKLFGKKVSDQCLWMQWPLEHEGEDIVANTQTPALSDDKFRFRGLIVSSQCCDVASINSLGHFVSIDGRPVSCRSGVLLDLIKHYRKSLKQALEGSSEGRLSDPLLVLNIDCPNASYDVNIEPAKDDVLFRDASALLATAKASFSHFLEASSIKQPNEEAATRLTILGTVAIADDDPSKDHDCVRSGGRDEFITSSWPGRPVASHSGPGKSSRAEDHLLISPEKSLENRAMESPNAQKVLHGSRQDAALEVSSDDVDDVSEEDEEFESSNINLSNPWVLAKLNASNHSQKRSLQGIPTPMKQKGDAAGDATPSPAQVLAHNRRVSQPIRLHRQIAGVEHDGEVIEDRNPQLDTCPTGPNSLEKWLATSSSPKVLTTSVPLPDRPPNLQHSHYTPASAFLGLNQGIGEGDAPSNEGPVSSEIHPDLAETMDYEARKQAVGKQHRIRLRREKAAATAQRRREERLCQQQQEAEEMVSSCSPVNIAKKNSAHRNRYTSAVAALKSSEGPVDGGVNRIAHASAQKDKISPPPQRPYKNPRKITSHLPLGHVDEDDWIDNLIVRIRMTPLGLTSLFTAAAERDDYINQGHLIDAFANVEPEEATDLKESVQDLARRTFRRPRAPDQDPTALKYGGEAETGLLEFDLQAILEEQQSLYLKEC